MNTLTISEAALRLRPRRRVIPANPRDVDAMLNLLRATLAGLHQLHRPVYAHTGVASRRSAP